MTFLRNIAISIILISPFIAPPLSFPEIEISLKNGGTIIAEGCSEKDDLLICSKLGGFFEIEKNDVSDYKEITSKQPVYHEAPENSSEPAPGDSPEAGIYVSDATEPANGGPDYTGQGQDNAPAVEHGNRKRADKKLDRITRKKMELTAVRKKLMKERDLLHKDVKNAGVIKTGKQLREILKRMSDLDARTARFNREIDKLSKEEQAIIEELEK
ncbi:MAG: hypothetical protein VST72_07995 [Nitrospirota bacterium]|nr:hypothetical protein [Nitrospirota bacterium]